MKNKPHLSIRRLVFVLIVMQVGFLLLVGKLFKLQISNEATPEETAERTWLSPKIATIKRGKILDRDGNI